MGDISTKNRLKLIWPNSWTKPGYEIRPSRILSLEPDLYEGHAGQLGASWQRCKVHFVRNILAKVPHKEKGRFAAHLKQIRLEPGKKSAKRAAAALIEDYGKRFSDAVRCLKEGFEDSLSFYDFPEVDKKRISSTNGQERLNLEVRRRSRVVGVFPSVPCFLRLTICYFIEYSEDWENERSYIREDKT